MFSNIISKFLLRPNVQYFLKNPIRYSIPSQSKHNMHKACIVWYAYNHRDTHVSNTIDIVKHISATL